MTAAEVDTKPLRVRFTPQLLAFGGLLQSVDRMTTAEVMAKACELARCEPAQLAHYSPRALRRAVMGMLTDRFHVGDAQASVRWVAE